MSRKSDYITEARAAARDLLDAYQRLIDMQFEWNALDYGTTLGDGEGDNLGVTSTQVGAVVFDTANAFTTVFNAGHATNLAKLL